MNEKGDYVMRKSMIAALLASTLTLGACTSVDDARMSDVGTGAALGAAGGAAVGALTGGVGIIEGAAVGAAIGGLAGAVWSDSNNDGQVDGYIYNGQYYPGQPPASTAPTYPAPVRAGERG